jgi:acyl-CoA thioester hydrolase
MTGSNREPRPQPTPSSAYPVLRPIAARWMDNDVDGHPIEHGALDIHAGAAIGLVVETRCHCFESLAPPQTVRALERLR